MSKKLIISGVFACVSLWGSAAPTQEPIVNNDFAIDAFDGPVLGSSRWVSLGGAATAVADGIAGVHWNPACFASRYLFELDWWEWDLALSYFSPGVFGQTDIFNNGVGLRSDAFHFGNSGLRFQFGRLGLGLDFRGKTFRVATTSGEVDVELLEGHSGLGWAFADGQLVLGLAVRGADLYVKKDRQELVRFSGVKHEFGLLVRPEGQRWRLGLVGRLPIESTIESGPGVIETNGVKSAAGFVLPQKVSMPWELRAGLAWQFFGRPLNQRWREARDVEEELEARLELLRCRRRLEQLKQEAEAQGRKLPPARRCPAELERPKSEEWWAREWQLRRREEATLKQAVAEEEERIYWARRRGYEALPRDYLLVSFDVVVTGATAGGVGLDAFLQQQRRLSGKNVSVGFGLGAEAEPWTDRLKVRAGFYLEPARISGSFARPHGTVGFEAKLFSWDLFGWVHPFSFSFLLAGDFAPRYADLGLGVGFWH